MTQLADVLQSVSVILACLTIILGVDAWRREFIGKRKIELAEDVLTRFYEAGDAIARIRSPFSTSGEGSERKKSPNEGPAASELLDRAYVVFARYEKEQELFNRLHALRYQVMARISLSAAQPFDHLRGTLNEIFASAHSLGTYYWPRQGRITMAEEEFQMHLDEMHRHEGVFWAGFGTSDPTAERVEKAISDIESVCRPVLEERTVGFILTEPISRIFRKRK
jgi:hypothetical protein